MAELTFNGGFGVGSEAVVVGCKEIAQRCGVSDNLVAVWKRRGLLGEPSMVVGGRPAWWWHEVAARRVVRARLVTVAAGQA